MDKFLEVKIGDVDETVESVQKALAHTRLSLPQIEKKVLKAIGDATAKEIKKGIKATLHKRTGQLLKAYKYKANKNGGSVRVDAPNGDELFKKVAVLNYGYNGNVGRARNKPHGFVERGERFIESNSYGDAIEKLVEKELKKQWG